MKSKKFWCFILITGVGIVVSSLLRNPNREINDHLRIALPRVNLSIDPHSMEDSLSMFLVQQIHRSLFRYNSDGRIVPDLADKLHVSEDMMTYTIKIKSKQKFSDGSEITAKDVVQSLKRPFKLQASITADLNYIVGAKNIAEFSKNGQGIKSISEDTIEIKVSRPTDLLILHLALPDLAIIKISSEDQIEFEATAGDYFVKSMDDNEIVLLKSKQLGTGAPSIVTLSRQSIESALDGAFNNQVDSVEVFDMNKNDEKKLLDLNWKKILHSLSYENFLLLNPDRISRDQRELMLNSIKNQEIVSELSSEHIKPAWGLIPPILPGAIDQKVASSFLDVAIAKNFQMREVELSFNKENRLHDFAAKKISNYWKSIGITVKLNPLPSIEFYELLFNKGADAIIAGKGLDYPDGLANLTYFRTDLPTHFIFMENNSLDSELINLTDLNGEERFQRYKEIQVLILKQRTIWPLFFGNSTSGLWSPRIHSIPAHPMGFHFLKISEIKM